MSAQLARRILTSSILIIPPSLYVLSNFYTTCKINGNSMAPTLQDGDVVLVKKVDFLPYYLSEQITIDHLNNDLGSGELDQIIDRQRSLIMDASVGVPEYGMCTLWRSPPIVTPGDVLAFKNPVAFGCVDVKRLVALNGQRLRPKNSYHRIEHVRPYSVWMEGDNTCEVEGSQPGYNGLVSKKLIVGKVQCIIWPVLRRGSICCERSASERAWWP